MSYCYFLDKKIIKHKIMQAIPEKKERICLCDLKTNQNKKNSTHHM